MTKSVGLSLWLTPSGITQDRFRQLISQLAHQYKTPVFPPHVTLLGDLLGDEKSITAQAQQIAARIRPFQVTLTTVDYSDAYFRCLFLRAEETQNLIEANQIARSIFHREQDSKFMPHLSLLYGTFPIETKKQIIASIGCEFNVTFAVNSIHFLSCNGEPKEWYKIKEFLLKTIELPPGHAGSSFSGAERRGISQ